MQPTSNFGLPALGAGAGLRHEHFDEIIESKPPFRWFEIILEDFMDVGGYPRECLDRIRENYTIVTHGVCLSIGSTDPLDKDYLTRLKKFIKEIDPPWSSDHLCFTMVDHVNLVDLIPLPFTEEAVKHIIERVKVVQDTIEKPFLLENVTRYLTVSDREMSEAEFLTRVVEGANCGILLDLTNVHLNAKFHGYDAEQFISSLPLNRVGQIHLAGWEPDIDGTIIDSHDAPVPPEVWALLRSTISKIGKTSVLIEWDKSLQSVERLLEETVIADRVIAECTSKKAA